MEKNSELICKNLRNDLNEIIKKFQNINLFSSVIFRIVEIFQEYKKKLKKTKKITQKMATTIEIHILPQLEELSKTIEKFQDPQYLLKLSILEPFSKLRSMMEEINNYFRSININIEEYEPTDEDVENDLKFLYGFLTGSNQENLQYLDKLNEISQYLKNFNTPIDDNDILNEIGLSPDDYTKDSLISEEKNISFYNGTLKSQGIDVKILHINVEDDDGSTSKETFFQMSKLLSFIHHPSIAPFIGACFENYEIVIQENGKPLRSLLKIASFANDGYSKTVIAFKVAEAMMYLHSKNLIHRDLCTPNILVDKKLKISITGFTRLRFVPDVEVLEISLIAKENFKAPELLAGESYSEQIDVFSFSAVLFELLTGKPPYGDLSQVAAQSKVKQNKRPHIPKHCLNPNTHKAKKNLKELIRSCWHHDPKKRPSFSDIVRRMQEQQISFPGADQDRIANFYSSTKTKSSPVLQCLKIFHNINTEINQVEFYERELIRIRGTLYSYQYELQTSEYAQKTDSNDSIELLALKNFLDELYENIKKITSEKLIYCIFLSNPQDITIELEMLMDEIYSEMRKLNLNVARYKTCNNDLAADYRYLFSCIKGIQGYEADKEDALKKIEKYLESKNISLSVTKDDLESIFCEMFSRFKNKTVSRDRFNKIKQINKGATATVYLAIDTVTSKTVAIKEFLDEFFQEETAIRNLKREIFFLVTLDNEFLVDFVGINAQTMPFWIVMEYVSEGDLCSLIYHQKLNPFEKTKIAFEIAEGMEFLHSKQVMHRDLKTSNILIQYDPATSQPIPKIADFGYARVNTYSGMTAHIGTVNYEAPEVIKGDSYDFKADVFSYGMILWEMLTSTLPYSLLGNNIHSISNHIINGVNLPFNPVNGEEVSPTLKDLIKKCWSPNPSDRDSFSEIIDKMIKLNISFPGSNPEMVHNFYKLKKEKREEAHEEEALQTADDA